MNKPLFSVIIPVYNVEKYLSFCLDSVLGQTFSDYEVILIDDGSTDSSGRICDDYANRFPDRFRVQHKPNQGLISARRAGLKLVKGQFVCFMDSDDCWVDNTLSRLHEIIKTTDSDVVLFLFSRIDENGGAIGKAEPGWFEHSGSVEKKEIIEELLLGHLNSLCFKCCRYELFDIDTDYSNFYNIQLEEDLLQCLPVMYTANRFYYLDEPLYQYRINPTSISQNYQKEQYRRFNIVRPLLYQFIEKMGLDTEQNKKNFFHTYLANLWSDVEAMYTCISSKERRNAALDEVRSYEFVKKGRAYLGWKTLSKRAYLGLSIFYKNNNKIMNAYMRLYFLAVKVYRGAKSILRKCFKQPQVRG